jgi:CheY-like chemotaxis protein
VGAGADPSRRAPLGIVGPGATPGPERERAEGEGREDERLEPRRFVVPEPRESAGPEPAEVLAELRRLVRDGGIVLGAEQTSLFLFGQEEHLAVRRIVRFHLPDRRFEGPGTHPPELAGEVRAFLVGASRAEIRDVDGQHPPSGPLRDYLRDAGVKGLLSLPVRRAERIVGFLSFESTSGPRTWGAGDRTRAREVTLRIEAALPPDLSGGDLWDAAVEWGDAEEGPGRRAGGALPGRPPEVSTVRRSGAVRAPPDPRAARWPDPSAPEPEAGLREIETRLPRLRPLEGAALLGAELGEDLLHLIDVHDATLRLLDRVVEGEGAELASELRELSQDLRKGVASMVRVPRSGMTGGEVVDVGEVLSGAVRRFAEISGGDVRLLVSPAADVLPVRGDPALLERVVRNLVANARQATGHAGRIRLSWERARVEGGLRGEGEEPVDLALIRVEDDGAGIRPEHLPWIFEPYFTTGGKGHHSGLGLSTVQAVVEGHGGWVDVRSTVGEGTTLSVHLPLAREPVGARPRVTEAPHPEAAGILVIEDEPALARLLVRVLEAEGYRVSLANSEASARRSWAESEGSVDLVLLERKLAGAPDGSALARGWKRRRPDLRVMLVDRGGDPERPLPGDPWIDAVLRPPFDPGTLVRLVAEELDRGHHEKEGVDRHEKSPRRVRRGRSPSIDLDVPPHGSVPH